MSKVVVTGGAGFIGANVVRRLLDRGVEVVILDDFSTGSLDNIRGLDAEIVEGSILDLSTLKRALNNSSSVIHLAALPSVARSTENPKASHEANATGTIQVLEMARRLQVGHVIVASSSSVYGGSNNGSPAAETDAVSPRSPYAASKLASEAYALAYQSSFHMPTIVFRFFNVYGPLQPAGHAYAACIPAFLTAALLGEPLIVNGDGRQSRDFTFVGDVSEIIVQAALSRTVSESPVNLAFGNSVDLLQLIGVIAQLVGRPLETSFVSARVGDVRHSKANPKELIRLFPEVQPTPLEKGLELTVEWWRTRIGTLGEKRPADNSQPRTP